MTPTNEPPLGRVSGAGSHRSYRTTTSHPAQPGEVLVRTIVSGISAGTELHVYRGDISEGVLLDESLPSLQEPFRYPATYGYASVGEVVDDGRRVFAFQPHVSHYVARRRRAVRAAGRPIVGSRGAMAECRDRRESRSGCAAARRRARARRRTGRGRIGNYLSLVPIPTRRALDGRADRIAASRLGAMWRRPVVSS